MTGGAALVRGDALRIPLADDSVDLVVTSPPYFGQRSYRDGDEHYDGQIGAEPTPTEFIRALWGVMDELYRVVKPGGVVFVNLGDKMAGSGGGNWQTGVSEKSQKAWGADGDDADVDGANRPRRYVQTRTIDGEARPKSVLGVPWRFALGCAMPGTYRAPLEPDDDRWLESYPLPAEPRSFPRWINRRPLTWEKPNGMPESVTDRPRANVEDFFFFTKSERYYSALDELRKPHVKPPNGTLIGGPKFAGADGMAGSGARTYGETVYTEQNPLGRLPGSVWTIPTEPLVVPEWLGVDHYAAFPTEWPRRLILGFSPPGICSACGEGRRPIVEKPRDVDFDHVDSHNGPGAVGVQQYASGKEGAWGAWRGGPSAQINGYGCSCPTPDAPTRPAVVLDPFGGTGTTAMVAKALGRFGVSLDLSADYLKLARWRVFDSGHDLKAIERTYGAGEARQETRRRAAADQGVELLSLFDTPAEPPRPRGARHGNPDGRAIAREALRDGVVDVGGHL